MKKQHNNLLAVLILGAGVLMASPAQARCHGRERHPDLRLAVDIVGTLLYAVSPKTVVVAPEPARTVVVSESVYHHPGTVVVSRGYCPPPRVYHHPAPVIYHRPAPVVYHRPPPVVYHHGDRHFHRGHHQPDYGDRHFHRGHHRSDHGHSSRVNVRHRR